MNVTESQKLIGKIGSVYLAGMYVKVKIIDIFESWGMVKAIITPVSGSGQVNVLLDRVRIIDDKG